MDVAGPVVLPFLALRPRASWLWLSGAVGISYASALAAGTGPWQELAWPRWLEFGPFVILLLAETWRGRVNRERGAA